MAITDVATGAELLPDPIEVTGGTYASASAAYTAWATEHGLSPTATIDPLSLDDECSMVDIGFPALPGSTYTSVGICGEASIALYLAPRTGGSLNAVPNGFNVAGINIQRLYQYGGTNPSITFIFKPDTVDSGTQGGKVQNGANVAILFFQAGGYANRTDVDVAIRIKPGYVEFVFTVNASANPNQNFTIARSDQSSSTVTPVSASRIAMNMVGTKHFILGQPDVVRTSPLGLVSARAIVGAKVESSAPPALGAPSARSAVSVSSSASATTPLGSPVALSASASSRASVESPLTPAIVRAVMGGRALAAVPSVLSRASALVNHDFTVALGDVTARYLMDLVTPSGLVRAPISSWQATLQTGGKCYVQAVVPASTQYADAINAASEFVISRAAVLPSGMQVEQEMARAPLSAQFDRGAMRETCTISGYADGFQESDNPPAEYDRTLSRIRSMSSGAGGMRVRCAVDWLLRPGQRAFADGVPMIADYINYYAPTGGDSYMDVGERA